jgi:N-acetylmuramoyl-L-alanine amidase
VTAQDGQVGVQSGQAISFDVLTSPVYQKVIMIDVGHGGDDPGAIGPKGTKEKDINLEIAHQLRILLEQGGASIIMTRTGDYQVPLHDRPKLANEAKPDIFVSIHNNSYMRDSAGTETYYFTTNQNSKALAESLHSELIKGIGLPDRRVRIKDFVVIRDTLAPSVLLEIAFLSNPKEEKLLLDPGFRLKAAESIRRGIFKYFWEQRSQAEVGRS